jgi:hypothetical protein
MKISEKSIVNARLHWLLGILSILAIIAITVFIKEISVKTGLIMGGMVVIAAPFILWFSDTRKKHDDNIHYHEEGSVCYLDEDGNCTEEP